MGLNEWGDTDNGVARGGWEVRFFGSGIDDGLYSTLYLHY